MEGGKKWCEPIAECPFIVDNSNWLIDLYIGLMSNMLVARLQNNFSLCDFVYCVIYCVCNLTVLFLESDGGDVQNCWREPTQIIWTLQQGVTNSLWEVGLWSHKDNIFFTYFTWNLLCLYKNPICWHCHKEMNWTILCLFNTFIPFYYCDSCTRTFFYPQSSNATTEDIHVSLVKLCLVSW